MKLSILMPVYNENRFLEAIVERVLKKTVKGIDSTELIIVDDCSQDGTADIVRRLAEEHSGQIKAAFHEKNQGKGAAIHTAIEKMSGDVCIIQDADLEYDPEDYDIVLEPIITNRADCVYGSRFIRSRPTRVLFFWHYVGNKFLTLLSNMCTNLNLTDMETCYKAFKVDLLKSIPLRSKRFGLEPEVTAKVARRGCRIYEVGINYNGRTYDEGKKINWKDGFQAIYVILKFCFVHDHIKSEAN